MRLALVFIIGLWLMASAVDYRDFQPADSGRAGENVEWGISYAFNKLDKSGAPRVLVIGDSICNGYSGALRAALGKKMNYSFWASSLCVRDPLYFKTLDLVLDGPKPDIILFNNTLHSNEGNDEAWRVAFCNALKFMHAKLPKAKIIVLNGTPLRNDAKWVVDKNEIAAQVASQMGLPLIDLYSFCKDWDRNAAWRDNAHFQLEYVQKQAAFLAEEVLRAAKDMLLEKDVQQKGSATGPDGEIK